MPQAAEQFYIGEKGKEYATAALATDDRSQDVIAKQRARKLQPLVSSADTVLEMGVGLGTNLRYLKCQRRVGFDLGDFGRSDCERFGIEFFDDLQQLGDAKFSAVLLHHCLEHVPNPLEMIDTAKRFLQPQGRLMIFVPKERCGPYSKNDYDHHLYSWTLQTLGNLVTTAGLEILELRLGPFGYERRLAPLARFGMAFYRFGLFAVRLLRPVQEIVFVGRCVIPRGGSTEVEARY